MIPAIYPLWLVYVSGLLIAGLVIRHLMRRLFVGVPIMSFLSVAFLVAGIFTRWGAFWNGFFLIESILLAWVAVEIYKANKWFEEKDAEEKKKLDVPFGDMWP
ncbi:MAG: hypothetical protein ACTHLB_14550 [Parafilimonas sp.]